MRLSRAFRKVNSKSGLNHSDRVSNASRLRPDALPRWRTLSGLLDFVFASLEVSIAVALAPEFPTPVNSPHCDLCNSQKNDHHRQESVVRSQRFKTLGKPIDSGRRPRKSQCSYGNSMVNFDRCEKSLSTDFSIIDPSKEPQDYRNPDNWDSFH